MSRMARSSAEASPPWVLTCRGTFLEVLPEGDAPPRPPRAASAPADVGRSPRGNLPFAALEPRLERRLQVLRQSVARTKGGNSRGGDSSGDSLLSGEGFLWKDPIGGKILPAWASSESLGGDAMDHQTSEWSAMTMRDQAWFMSSTTVCPDDDVHGDDVTERASTKSTAAEMTMCTGSDDARREDTRIAQTSRASEAMNDDPRLRGKTWIMRNIPCRITHEELVRVIAQQGFGGRYDFVYMPQSHRPKTNIGYAFVNLIDEADGDAFELAFNGFRFQGTASQKVCAVQPASLQGIDAQLGHRRRTGRGLLASTATR